jgi:GTPase SAR1 family protein
LSNSYSVYHVFTPSSPAKENYIERDKLSSRIASSLSTPGKQIVVFGHSGVGKTSLLRKQLERQYEKEIITSCMTNLTFESILLDAFDQLDEYYVSQKKQANDYGIESSIANDYFALKSSIKAYSKIKEEQSSSRIIEIQLTASRLADFLGEGGYCWVLEDFHKVDKTEKTKLSQTMKLFMDKSIKYNNLKIIAIGAVDTGREVIEYDSEMKKRISEIEVKLMSDVEIGKIIKNGEILLNISIEKRIHTEIVKFSNGIASVCHSICLYMCEEKGILNTVIGDPIKFNKADLENSIQRYMEEESDTMKDRFNKALIVQKEKNKNVELILKSLTKFPSNGATNSELLSIIRDEKIDYHQNTLPINLEKMQLEERGALIRFDNSSAKFSFKEPFYKPFALAFFQEEDKSKEKILKNSLKTLIGKMAYEAIVEEQLKKYVHSKSSN